MKKLLNISLCLILTFNFGYSQSIKRSVICSYGASLNTTNSIVETTFGQPPNIGTITDGTYFIRQGFQQPLYNLIPVLLDKYFIISSSLDKDLKLISSSAFFLCIKKFFTGNSFKELSTELVVEKSIYFVNITKIMIFN